MTLSSDNNDELLLLLITLLVADRMDVDWSELDPYIQDLFIALDKMKYKQGGSLSHLPFPIEDLTRRLRRSFEKAPMGMQWRRSLTRTADEIYQHIRTDLEIITREQFRRQEGRENLSRPSNRIDRSISTLEARILNIGKTISEIQDRQVNFESKISTNLRSIADELKTFEWGLSIGILPEDLLAKRSIPVRIYLSEALGDDTHRQIIDAVAAALEELHFEKNTELPEEGGSWWKRFWATTKDPAIQAEVYRRLEALERGAEIAIIEKPQASANKDHATAIATLIKALEKSNKAAIHAGNVLLLKNNGDYIVKTLSPAQMRALEKNPELMKNPHKLLVLLKSSCNWSDDSEA